MTNRTHNAGSQSELETTKHRLLKRLNQYWKIERVNIFWLPIVAIYIFVFVFRKPLTLSFGLSLLATAWLLVVGTIALRMLPKRLELTDIGEINPILSSIKASGSQLSGVKKACRGSLLCLGHGRQFASVRISAV